MTGPRRSQRLRNPNPDEEEKVKKETAGVPPEMERPSEEDRTEPPRASKRKGKAVAADGGDGVRGGAKRSGKVSSEIGQALIEEEKNLKRRAGSQKMAGQRRSQRLISSENHNPPLNDEKMKKETAVVPPEMERPSEEEHPGPSQASKRKGKAVAVDAAAAADSGDGVRGGAKRPRKVVSEIGRKLMEEAAREKAKAGDKWHKELCRMCHQCQRSDKERIVRCSKCEKRRYCTNCIKNW